MKILRVEYQNINLYNDNLIIDFTASDRVLNTDQVNIVSKSIYLQKVIALAGINATGKTTTLRLIDFAMNLINDNTYLAQIKMKYEIFKDDTKLIIDFIEDKEIYRLESRIGIKNNIVANEINLKNTYYYKEEKIYCKPVDSVKLKRELFNWDIPPLHTRSGLDEKNLQMIKDNQSIIVLITKEKSLIHLSFIDAANQNLIYSKDTINKNIYNLFDNNIENIRFIDETNFEIKYKNSEKVFTSNSIEDQYHFLSSGTIRGPILIKVISLILKTGGCLIIDEIEIHLNKTLIEVIIDLFKDKKTNTNGATLLFTTHYLEILDVMERKDNIYVARKDKSFNLSVTKFSNKIKRNDIKKSEILLSNYFENTAPSYAVIQKIKEDICK